ncbi:hypothetical protein [Rhodoferax sp. OV413]|uniref:hypothetical protein n=1 Tax=Rhodoferax sp. OV413 TaxID=1855285 RepID=UPI00115FD564|nr:hypothetical protein [Rhodoferax sp. OV413]
MKISREELYRRVWATPVRTLAKEFGISDVGLAKVCRKNHIPLPPVGHWMKVQHGKAVSQPALPPLEAKELVFEANSNRFHMPAMPDVQALATKVPELDFTVPDKAIDLGPIAAQTHKALLAAKPDARGLVACAGSSAFNCAVSPDSVSRTVRMLHAIEVALPQLNARLTSAGGHSPLVVEYEGTTVRMRVIEAYTRSETKVQNSKYEWDYTKTYRYHLTGRLTFEIEEWFDGQKRWSDTARQSMEGKLGGFILSLVDAAKAIIQRKLEWAEQERLREEAARKRDEAARRLKEEQAFRQQLFDEAALWHRCEAVRQYLDHVRGRFATSKQPILQRDMDWLEHAELVLADMLPLERRLAQATAPSA